jgi:hypothetical protein
MVTGMWRLSTGYLGKAGRPLIIYTIVANQFIGSFLSFEIDRSHAHSIFLVSLAYIVRT